jgi:hypothetical protein
MQLLLAILLIQDAQPRMQVQTSGGEVVCSRAYAQFDWRLEGAHSWQDCAEALEVQLGRSQLYGAALTNYMQGALFMVEDDFDHGHHRLACEGAEMFRRAATQEPANTDYENDLKIAETRCAAEKQFNKPQKSTQTKRR